MTGRILPEAEWDRLTDPETRAMLPVLRQHASEMTVLVVEEGDQIVMSWVIQTIRNLHGMATDPAYRGRPDVLFRMLRLMKQTVRAEGAQRVATTALTPEINALCQALGGTVNPGIHYVFPVKES